MDGLGHRRLLGDPLREVRVGPFHPLRDHARDTLDLRLQLRVDAHAEPGDLRHDRDGAVVVGRAEPTGRGDEIRGADGLGDGRLELRRIVADDVDPRRLDAEREQ